MVYSYCSCIPREKKISLQRKLPSRNKFPNKATSRSSSARTASPQFNTLDRGLSAAICETRHCSSLSVNQVVNSCIVGRESFNSEVFDAAPVNEALASQYQDATSGKCMTQTVSPRRSNRITKPPVPQLSSRSRRPKPVESPGPVVSQPTQSVAETNFPVNTPMYPFLYPGNFMIPVTSLYGQVQGHQMSGATVIYTSGVIPPNTSSIIFIPVSEQANQCVSSFTPSPPPPTTAPSECSEPIRLDQPLVVFIERNVFKQWFEIHMPPVMREIPQRVKRYKSVDTFIHWLSSRKKHEQLNLNILIRVTEVGKVMTAAKSLRNFRIFAYEHLLDPAELPGNCLRDLSIPNRKEFDAQRLSVCRCLEEACRKLLTALKSPEIS